LPKLITFEPPPWTWFMRKIQNPKRRTNGRRPVRIDHQAEEPVPFESYFSSGFFSLAAASSAWRRGTAWSAG